MGAFTKLTSDCLRLGGIKPQHNRVREMKLAHASCIGFLFAAGLSLFESADAAIINYDLTANPSYSIANYYPPDTNGYSLVTQTFPLADASTGASQQSARTVSVGDTISGTINFSSPYSQDASPLGDTFLVFLQSAVNYGFAYIASSLSFYKDGALVDTPVHAGQGQSSAPTVFASAFSSGITPAYTFDRIVFSTTVSRIYDQSLHDVPSVNLIAGTPQLLIYSYAAPVPLPACLWLLASGLGGVGIFARRKRAAKATN